jgi:hypothetical protein
LIIKETLVTIEEVERFVAFFYQGGDISLVPEAIQVLAKEGKIHGVPRLSWWAAFTIYWRRPVHIHWNAWAQENDYFVTTFLAEVLRQNGAEAAKWYEQFGALSKSQLRTIWMAYSLSGCAEARSVLEQQKHLVSFPDRCCLNVLTGLTPTPFLELPLKGPATLDIWWTCFAATGDLAAVTNIIHALVLVAEKEGSPKHAIGVSALWSLTSQALEHEAVANHIRQMLELVTDEGMRIMLEGALPSATRG